jgi:chromosome partitioning protein
VPGGRTGGWLRRLLAALGLRRRSRAAGEVGGVGSASPPAPATGREGAVRQSAAGERSGRAAFPTRRQDGETSTVDESREWPYPETAPRQGSIGDRPDPVWGGDPPDAIVRWHMGMTAEGAGPTPDGASLGARTTAEPPGGDGDQADTDDRGWLAARPRRARFSGPLAERLSAERPGAEAHGTPGQASASPPPAIADHDELGGPDLVTVGTVYIDPEPGIAPPTDGDPLPGPGVAEPGPGVAEPGPGVAEPGARSGGPPDAAAPDPHPSGASWHERAPGMLTEPTPHQPAAGPDAGPNRSAAPTGGWGRTTATPSGPGQPGGATAAETPRHGAADQEGLGAGQGQPPGVAPWNEPALPTAWPSVVEVAPGAEVDGPPGGAPLGEPAEQDPAPSPDPSWPRLFPVGSGPSRLAGDGPKDPPPAGGAPGVIRAPVAGTEGPATEAGTGTGSSTSAGGVPAGTHANMIPAVPAVVPGRMGPEHPGGVPRTSGPGLSASPAGSSEDPSVSRETGGGGDVVEQRDGDEQMEDEAAIAVRAAVSRAAAEAGQHQDGVPQADVSRETSADAVVVPEADAVIDLVVEPADTIAQVDSEQAARNARVTFRIQSTTNGKHRVLAVANQKGGVGKSTTAVNLGAYLALAGARVLVVDLDPQGNASTGLGLEHRDVEPSIYDVLTGETAPTAAIRATSVANLHVLPSTIDLAGAEVELVSAMSREGRLRRALAAINGYYDSVLIDCPPSLGLLTVNALAAANELLIPIQCEYYALEGLGQLLRNVELVRANLNPDLRIGGIVLTMYDGRTRLAEQVVQEVRKHFSDLVYQTVVPRSVRLSEAPGYGLPIALYDPLSRGGIAYRDLAFELAERSGLLAPTAEGAS